MWLLACFGSGTRWIYTRAGFSVVGIKLNRKCIFESQSNGVCVSTWVQLTSYKMHEWMWHASVCWMYTGGPTVLIYCMCTIHIIWYTHWRSPRQQRPSPLSLFTCFDGASSMSTNGDKDDDDLLSRGEHSNSRALDTVAIFVFWWKKKIYDCNAECIYICSNSKYKWLTCDEAFFGYLVWLWTVYCWQLWFISREYSRWSINISINVERWPATYAEENIVFLFS